MEGAAAPWEPVKAAARRGSAQTIETALDIALAPPDDETKARMASKGRRPLRIGVHRDVPLAFQDDLLARLHWAIVPDGAAVGVVTVTSPGAESIRVSMRAQLPAGAELRFFRPHGDAAPVVVDAVFTQADFFAAAAPKSAPLLWSPSISGDAIGIEITLPAGARAKGAWFRVEKVAHRF